MKYGDQTTLRQSFAIQRRVIGALMMREIITRFGRKNLGFLWLFIEPLLMTLLIVAFWKLIRADQFSTLNIVAFTATGYPLAMMWRNASNRAIGAISANASLLYHRNVRVLDTIFTRILLEITGATIAQILLMTLLITIGLIPMPHDVFYMIMAWGLMALFAVGLGLIICSVAYHFEVFGKLWGTFSFILLPLSGAFFFVHSLPSQTQHYVKWIPMISGTEMFRHGYFGDIIPTYEQITFLIICDLAMILLGLILVKQFSRGIDPQ